MKQIWIRHAGKVHGPYDPSTVKEMALAGTLRREMEISQNQTTWQIAGKVAGLFESSPRRTAAPTAASALNPGAAVDVTVSAARATSETPPSPRAAPQQSASRSDAKPKQRIFAYAGVGAAVVALGFKLVTHFFGVGGVGCTDDDVANTLRELIYSSDEGRRAVYQAAFQASIEYVNTKDEATTDYVRSLGGAIYDASAMQRAIPLQLDSVTTTAHNGAVSSCYALLKAKFAAPNTLLNGRSFSVGSTKYEVLMADDGQHFTVRLLRQ